MATVENILQDFLKQLEEKVSEFSKELERNLDFLKIEQALNEVITSFTARVLEQLLNQVLNEPETLKTLREVGGRKALHFKEYRKVTVHLGKGQIIKVQSPYFIKATPKRGRKKRGPNGRGNHLGLEVLGFIGRCSINLVSDVAQAAILCPSVAGLVKTYNFS